MVRKLTLLLIVVEQIIKYKQMFRYLQWIIYGGDDNLKDYLPTLFQNICK